MEQKLILASASPRRKELLRLLVENFEIHAADVDETIDATQPIADEIMRLAEKKVRAVYEMEQDPCAVIGSDTVVTIDGVVLGKPVDEQDAARMLRLLSGRTHEVITAVTLLDSRGRAHTECNVTRVTFYELENTTIQRYIQTGEPMDKAGAYGIQGRGAVLVRRIEGDYCSVMGLPVAQLARLLQEQGLWKG